MDISHPTAEGASVCPPMRAHGRYLLPLDLEIRSVYQDSWREALEYKWILSQQLGYDLGEEAIRLWVKRHWHGFLRARWIEHLEGRRFWTELDRGDFGKLTNAFREHAVLLDCILDRLKYGQENLQIIAWACDWNIPSAPVIEILESLDINSRRMEHRFDPVPS